MPRYKLSPEERAAEKERKENLRNIMKGLDVKNFDDLKDVFKLMVGEMLENGLDGELDDELGYTKYDYQNKEGKNSRNGYSKKTLKTSFGETEIKVPRDRNGEFEPQLCINLTKENTDAVRKKNGISRVAKVIECVGRPETMEQAIHIAGKKSVFMFFVMFFGLTAPNDVIRLKPFLTRKLFGRNAEFPFEYR